MRNEDFKRKQNSVEICKKITATFGKVAVIFGCLRSILGGLGTFQLQLELVGNERDELGVRGLTLGVRHGVAEETLQSVQIAPVPGNFDGVADGPFHPAGRGAEGLGYLGVQHLGDGVDHVHVVHRNDDGLP